ncbi:tail fiber domain-containing protein [Paractinoplanes lichenicola]|uniref:Tail fiber domain-containing protein n=1 Tax=Paractinoplanes lichenicola TaxID=2802976 RepID=A0ABS1VU07_9ACTN|nr:tail fiber domain-containing protein [Actinoplanes lichenicola]MBL7257962.1 tail fiber domain-containing protein [Actinoplanes lichenicola]
MSWELDGNQVNGNNTFLGTRNNAALVIRTNTNGAPGNLEEVMRVTASSGSARGRVGIATSNPGQQLTLGAGNVMLPDAKAGTDGNLYFGGRTDGGENGLRLFGGDVNGNIPGGFIDVKTDDEGEGLRIRVDTANGGTERVRVAANGNVGIGTDAPSERLTLGSGNVLLPTADAGADGNLYFGGRTDDGETGMRLFGGNVNGTIPGGFIDVKSTAPGEGLRIRVDTGSGGTERLRVTSTEVRATVQVNAPSFSDLRMKENVRPLRGVLERLDRVRGVAFDWADTPDTGESRTGRPGVGVIAQDVEAVFPELVEEFGERRMKSVDYNGLVATLLAAAQELRDEVTVLRARITALEAS